MGSLRRARSARFAAWGERLWRRPFALRGDRAGGAAGTGASGHSARAPRCPRSRWCPLQIRRGSGTTRCSGRSDRAHGAAADRRPERAGLDRDRDREDGSRHRAGAAADARTRWRGADHGGSQAGPLESGRRRDDRPSPRRAPWQRAGRRRGDGESRPPGSAGGEDAARHRGGARARLPAAAVRASGAADRRGRRRRQPARDRGRLRSRQVDLPGRALRSPARLPAAGLPRRVGRRCSSSR